MSFLDQYRKLKGSKNLNQQGRDRRGTENPHQQKSRMDYGVRPKTSPPTAKKASNCLGKSKLVEKPKTELKKEKRQSSDGKHDEPDVRSQKYSPIDLSAQRQLQRMEELFKQYQAQQPPQIHKKKGTHTLEPISAGFPNFEPIPTHSYHQADNRKFLEDLDESQQETVYDDDDYTDDELGRLNESILDLSISKHQFKNQLKNMKKQESLMMKKRESRENPSANPSQNYSCAGGDHRSRRILTQESEIGKFRAAKDKCFLEIGDNMKKMRQLDECLYSLYKNVDKIKR